MNPTMTPLHRHQLARLSDAGWRSVQSCDWDPEARECIAHWAAECLPLVVTRQAAQTAQSDMDRLALGLPAPARWNRRRLALTVARGEVLYFDEFPIAEKVSRRLPIPARPAWLRLCSGLRGAGVNPRVYGSFGWEHLTGLDHVRSGSDVDLWLSVEGEGQADTVAACMQSFSGGTLRLDGELIFMDGSAVAWREWLAWRNGRVKTLLVKSIDGNALVHSPARRGAVGFAEAA
jgi:phosphoribosyl-dephospho-CoA transferase